MSSEPQNKSIILKRFGRYLLLDHLVDGGMAKICRARFLGEQADKIVAIKMIQPQYSKDPNFRKMFDDEVKVSFGLQHPNIAQTNDYGIHDDQLYIAMEYVDGKNLKQYLDKLKEKKYLFPVEISVYITSLVCQGLYYAHTYMDKLSGTQLNLIHRDISPHNIMLTYDGAVKIIDFGIAKSETNTESTQAGTIKGKLSYLAPEYLEGTPLDARYDQFSIGITLWEMLCCRKLFRAPNELAVLKEIQSCKIPIPSSINPNVPKELDQIVLKALSRDRNLRYENLDKMNRALIKFLYTQYPDFNPSDLGKFATSLFKEHIAQDRERLQEFGKIDIRSFLNEVKNETSYIISGTDSNPVSDAKGNRDSQELDFGFSSKKSDKAVIPSNENALQNIDLKKLSEEGKGSNDDKVSNELTLDFNKNKFDSKKNTKVFKNSSPGALNRSSELFDSSQEHTIISSHGSDRPSVSSSMLSKVLGAVVIILMALYAVPKFLEDPNIGERNPATNDQTEIKKPPVSQKGRLIITNIERFKHEVYLNGILTKIPIDGELELDINKSYTLRVQIKGRRPFIKTFSTNQSGTTINLEIPDMPVVKYGYLVTATDCVNGKLYFNLYGEERVENLPISHPSGIPFPIGKTKVEVKVTGEQFKRSGVVSIKHEDELFDFCKQIFW